MAWQNAIKNGLVPALPDNRQRFVIDFLPFDWRQLRRDGLHLFKIRYWDSVLPSLIRLHERVMIRYNPRDLSRVYVLGPEGYYHSIPYADIRHPAISLWEYRAAAAQLRAEHKAQFNEVAMFEMIDKQRVLVADSAAKTKEARRQQQRRKESTATPPPSAQPTSVDYSKPPELLDGEVWG